MAVTDEIVERVHQAADALIQKHGGFDGWVKHLIAKSRQRELAQKRALKKTGKKRRPVRTRAK